MDYSFYQAEDFAADETFIHWVLEPSPESTAFWQSWLTQHPEKKQTLDEARTLVLTMRFKVDLPSTELLADMWEHIAVRRQRVSPFRRIFVSVQRWQVAASVAFLLLVAAGTGYWLSQPKEVATRSGEFRTVELPDGSLITLNGNSRLRYNRFWDNEKSREVWLEGEAYFEIRKKPRQGAYSRFIAHAGNASIAVLGTKFNVKNRRGRIEVMLEEGKVQLNPNEQQNQPAITMKPGDVASIQSNTAVLLSRPPMPESYTAWKERKLVFDDLSLLEISEMLQETYGVQIKFADPELAQLRLKGKLYVKSVDTALEAMTQPFDLHYSKDGDVVEIRQR
ncbi:FecR family protein [Larkinella bovis]|uniref:FecR family protein n=1 Tax=Larkinella bovis TaxID=683041 RepID=A0ABW0I5B3_9BACT